MPALRPLLLRLGPQVPFMSWQAVSYAVAMLEDDQALTVADRLVMVLIAEHADRSGRAWPAADTVARRAGMHPSSVRRCIDRLELAGYLAVDHRPGTSNVYRFPVCAPIEISTPRAPGRAVDNSNPAPYSANPAPQSAGVRALGRDEPVSNRSMNQRDPISDMTCSWCDGTGWEYEDDNHVRRCRSRCTA